MKYFIDTEFIEGTQHTLFGHTKPTIDLISIGIIAENGREYYAISKDFNLKEAWNRWQPEYDDVYIGDGKKYWIRDNVLKPIYLQCRKWELAELYDDIEQIESYITDKERYRRIKYFINKYGKSNKQIAEEVKRFVSDLSYKSGIENLIFATDFKQPEFYGYYSDYDWVVFCWLFGRMIDLPKGFPMYCIDLKQELERLNETLGYNKDSKNSSYKIQEHNNYPKQFNEHNSLSDARWNKQLYEFLNTL